MRLVDAYTGVVTDHAARNCRDVLTLEDLTQAVLTRLKSTSGAKNVRNAILRKHYDYHACAVVYRVSFDSRAWTGL